MKKVLLMLAMLGFPASFAMAEDLADNPQYKQWSAFKVGAVVKNQSTTVRTVDDKEVTTKMAMTQTLKELTPEKAVVEYVIESEVNGQKRTSLPRTREIPAKVPKGAATQPAGPPGTKATQKGEGDEEIEVAGRKYKCHWVEVEISGDEFSSTTKTWTCADVPGGVVKMISQMTKPQKSKTTVELLEFKNGT